ncbi:hypothetical protein ASZ90_016568 [hydrocarbon metagenome]|uniref:Uncharacterized protein n=1 Tax=hydrocarbon metagenome TaxID=938273 RepID=A0A0W8ENA4_9ZZZZ
MFFCGTSTEAFQQPIRAGIDGYTPPVHNPVQNADKKQLFQRIFPIIF